MKKLKEYIVTIIILTTLTYLSFAFVKAELNSFNWEEQVRVCLVLTNIIMVPTGILIKTLIDNI